MTFFIYTILTTEKTSFEIKDVGVTGTAGNTGTTLYKWLCEKYNLTFYDIKDIRNSGDAKLIKAD